MYEQNSNFYRTQEVVTSVVVTETSDFFEEYANPKQPELRAPMIANYQP